MLVECEFVNRQIMKNLIKNRRFHILAFEAMGSFILTFGVCTSGKHFAPDVIIAAALFLAISQSGQITGGYINPIITIGMFIDKRHKKMPLYITAQVLGALIGAFISWGLLGKIEPPYNQGWDSFDMPKFFLNELIGSAVFTICVLTLSNKYTSYAVKSWQTYLSVPVALFLVRKVTGSTCINPAVGICLQMVAAWGAQDPAIFFRDVWPLIIPSVIGAIIGGYFMTKLYEPLLLFIKYKDLAEQQFNEQLQEKEKVEEKVQEKGQESQ